MTTSADVARRRRLRRFLRVGWYSARRFDIDARFRMVAFVRRVWTQGPAERSVLVALLVLTGAMSLAALSLVAPLAPLLHSGVGLGLFALAWSVALAAAADAGHPLALCAAAAWLIFYQGLVCGPWMGTPLAMLPTSWLAWILFRRLRSGRSSALGLATWLVAAAGLAYVTAGPSGLRRLLGWRPVDAQVLLWAGLAAAGLIAFSREPRKPPQPPGFSYTFWGALASVGLAGGASLLRDPARTADGLQLVFEDASAIVVLFWLWTAGRVAAEGVKGVEWAVRHSVRLLPSRVILPGVPLIILGTLVAGRAAPLPDLVEQAVHLAGIWAGIATLGVMAWWALTRQLTTSRVILALAWWLIARIVLGGVVTGSREVIEAHEAQAPVVGFGLFMVTAGLLLELGKLARNWADATAARVRGSLAMVTLSVSCAVALSAVPGNEWETTRLLMVLVGMLHLGGPLALYETWGMRRGGPVLDVIPRILILAAGYTAGLVVLVIDPQRWSALLAAAPLLVLLLAWLRHRRPDLPSAAGMLAGALFTSGLIAAWMHPNPPTIPFVPMAGLPRGVVLDKPLLSALHMCVLAAAWITGGGLGWLTFRRPGHRRD